MLLKDILGKIGFKMDSFTVWSEGTAWLTRSPLIAELDGQIRRTIGRRFYAA